MPYRIEWKSLLTPLKGNGVWYHNDKKKMLEESIKQMNLKYSGLLHHWLSKQDPP